MTTHPTPARSLVEAFGDCASMAAMYTDEVTWRMNHSLAPNIAGPHVGKEAVCAFNEAVFVELLDTHASIEQHQGNAVGVPPTP